MQVIKMYLLPTEMRSEYQTHEGFEGKGLIGVY